MTEGITSAAGIPLRPFYGPADGVRDYDNLADPGTYPFTRGRLTRTHGGPAGWIQRELSGEGSPRRSNQQLRALLAHGARGVDVIGDNPTVSALDPDHPMCEPAVGTTGVSLCRAQDFVELLEGIPLDRITLSHSLPPAFALAGQYLAGPHHGIDPAVLRGSAIQAPIYAEDCSYSTFLPFAIRMRLSLDSIVFSLREMPRFHAFLEDTYFISDGGLDVVEEMSLGLLEIREICRRLIARGLPVDAFAPRIAILVNCRMDLFEEIAKIRATRRLFARMMREEFGATDPRSWSVNIAVHTSGLTLTAAQPANNIVRGALQAMAMAMAGVQGLEISTFDEPFRTPSDIAHQLAIRTQQVIATETNIGAVADPLGGSYYLESFTDELEQRIDAAIRHMEQLGDVDTLVENGFFRGIFTAAMDRHSSAVQSGTLRIVGVNEHVVPPEADRFLRDVAEERFAPDRAHVERIRAWRPTRSSAPLAAALERVRSASADPDADLMGPIVAALGADATIGEITGCLREGQGLNADPFAFLASRPVHQRQP
ncbi:methylmalonyl-CoA mutase family protein [Dactylosporangium darangshiense]|uniref:Methylmalonyl-CoA mutase family protein n=1 Tax=Dactylosporangium darangshiense TaxID=579108 RepID=A0ABP8DUM4_9ACTN